MEKYYNPFGNKAVTINFQCDECSCEVSGNEIAIPMIDFSAETDRDSYNDNTEIVICDNCFKEFEITVWASSVGGYIELNLNDNLNNLICVTEIADKSDLFKDEFEELNKYVTILLKEEIKALGVKD